MKSYIGPHRPVSDADFIELALGLDDDQRSGLDMDLFRGPLSQETPEQRAARLDAARDILADLVAQAADDPVIAEDAAYAAGLMRTSVLQPRRPGRRRSRKAGVA